MEIMLYFYGGDDDDDGNDGSVDTLFGSTCSWVMPMLIGPECGIANSQFFCICRDRILGGDSVCCWEYSWIHEVGGCVIKTYA